MGLGDKWGHGAGTWGGFRGPAWWIHGAFRVTRGHGAGDHGGMRPLGYTWGHGAGTWGGFRRFRGQVGTRGWDMGWV